MTPSQAILAKEHGTIEEFETATWKAYDDGMITLKAAARAITAYRTKWQIEGARDNRRRIYG